MTEAFIGLGSNLGCPEARLREAVAQLDVLPATAVSGISPAYWAAPWGLTDQPEFLNAVVSLETTLQAPSLLEGLLAIEAGKGRIRDPEHRWGPRALDLDLLVFGSEQIAEEGLKVPHPRMGERPFVMVPLADLVPGLIIPGLGRAKELASQMDRSGLRRAEIDLGADIGQRPTGIQGEVVK